jgi:hypothetical protein
MSDDNKDYIFPQGIIRGLGLLPKEVRQKWPDARGTKSTEPEGVGKEPEAKAPEEKVPEGVGAAPGGKAPEGVGAALEGVGEINMPQQKIESAPWHNYVGPAAGSSGKSAEIGVIPLLPPAKSPEPPRPSDYVGPAAGSSGHSADVRQHAAHPPTAIAKTNIQQAAHQVAAGAQIPPKFDPRGFWYTHGAFPSKAPQAGAGAWQQVGQHWVWCPTSVTRMPLNLLAVCQVGSPGAGWSQIFNNYWVAKQVPIEVG